MSLRFQAWLECARLTAADAVSVLLTTMMKDLEAASGVVPH